MFAVIYQVPARPGAGMVRVAGRPLLERQLQWLRAAGCQRVAVEIGVDPESSALAAWLSEQEALGADVALVLAPRPLGPRDVAMRAGFPVGAPFIAVPSDVLGDGDLTLLFRSANPGGAWAMTEPPEGVDAPLESGTVRLMKPGGEHPKIITGAGWTARVGTVREAMALGGAALLGKLPEVGGDHVWPIQIHASEVAPGIWVSRGAKVDPNASLVAPVLVGPNAIVRAGARVGPRAFIEERAVIEAGATVEDASVEAGTIVGEGLLLRSCVASPEGVTELSNGMMAPLEDSLLIGRRSRRVEAMWPVRLLALSALLVFSPVIGAAYLARAAFGRRSWRAVTAPRRRGAQVLYEGMTGISVLDLAPRLFDVVRGARALVGVAPSSADDATGLSPGLVLDALSAPPGAIDVERALVPEDGDLETRMRGRAWYAQAKSPRVDMELLKRLLMPRRGASNAAT
jgi:hypothetical protein